MASGLAKIVFVMVASCQVAATGASSVAPPCNVSQSSDEVCKAFCNSECGFYNTSAGEDGQPKNVTLYRWTPRNVTGIKNKDTGDAPGDISFFLDKKNLTRECALDPTHFGCFLDSDNLYGEFVVEMSTQFGPYFECNPVNKGSNARRPSWVDTSEFMCGQDCLAPTDKGCGSFEPEKQHNGTDYFGSFQCWCDGTARHNKTVGREAAPSSGGGYSGGPKWWPKQCQMAFHQKSGRHKKNTCFDGKAYRQVHGWSLESTVAAACDACGLDDSCEGWATYDNRTATLFEGLVTRSNASCEGGKKHHSEWGGGSWGGAGNVGGQWYSTPVTAECAPGAPLGTDGCTWRVVTAHYKNASCVDKMLDSAVELRGEACFDTCEHPLNRTVVSNCYLFCYRNTLLGDPSFNLTAMSDDLIVKSWAAGFAQGGCPEAEPAHCEGSQCGGPPSLKHSLAVLV